MTKEELAARLQGTQYPFSRNAPKGIFAEAKAAGLLIVYGASDDLMEFDGAFRDELGCYEGGTALIDAEGLLDRSQVDDDDDEAICAFVLRKRAARSIEAIWNQDGYSWIYQTDIPHATFEVMEDDETYCRGLVIAMQDLTPAALG
jgi:hypothetical protein